MKRPSRPESKEVAEGWMQAEHPHHRRFGAGLLFDIRRLSVLMTLFKTDSEAV